MSLFPRVAVLLTLATAVVRSETPGEWMEKHLRDLGGNDMPGGAVLAARDGHIIFQAAYGMADLEKKTPNTPETKFRIGSITKQFTAAAILKLEEDRKLSVNDSLETYFPGFPNGKTITLRHLLTHTSGLHSYTEQPDFLARVTAPIAPAALIAEIRKFPPDFPAGTSFHYCNSGYFLLAEIVAMRSGEPFGAYLRRVFFDPLGMKDTGVYVNSAPPPNAARGYVVEKGKGAAALDWDMSWPGGAGAIYSTVADLWRWTESLHAGKVLNGKSLAAMITPNPLPMNADGLNYGFGLVISEIEHLPAIWHNGGLHGWSSNLVWLPRQKVTLVALANALPSAPGGEPATMTREMANHFLAEEIRQAPTPAADQTVAPKTYADFAGRYDYLSAVLTVTVDNGRLFAQLTGQPKFEIFPKSADEYFWKVTDARVRFLRDEKGAVIAAQHTQNGNTFKAARLNAGGQLTPAQLDAFVGGYQFAPGAVLTVRRDGDQLLAQLTGQPEFPIFPTGPESFEWRVVKANIRFVKGENGRITRAIHSQNGATIDAPRTP